MGSGVTGAATAYDDIRHAVLRRIEQRRLDPVAAPDDVRALIVAEVAEYQSLASLGQSRSLRDPDEMVGRVLSSITEQGPLTELLRRHDVEEVFIEGAHVTYLQRGGRLHVLTSPTSETENRHVIERLLSPTERRLDTRNPMVQARVLDGTARLTAAIPPVTDALSATIRRHALRRETLATLVDRGALTLPAASFVASVVRAGGNVLVSGPPGSGKTSLLSALIAAIPPARCIRCCEEVRELNVPLVHGAYYEARPPALDGSGEVTLRDLVKFVLAMRPDHLIVGEVRGAEAFELTRAVNAGCGFAVTVHANSARDALHALVNAAVMAGENVNDRFVRRVFARAIDVVVHLDRDPLGDGTDSIRRGVTEVLVLAPSLADDFTTEAVFRRDHLDAPLEWTGLLPERGGRLERSLPSGVSLRSVLEGGMVLV